MKLSAVIIVALFYLSDARAQDPCSEKYRCTLEQDTVWATDGYRCYIFINQCHLDLENCRRELAHLHPLEPIDKERCQSLCELKCPECDKPVCGIANCTLLDFPSLCWLDYYNCVTGQIYTLYNEGPCKR